MSNMVSDVSLWFLVTCAVGFLAGVGLTIKSYRDAKYASYFFLREEAALRVKRLLFVLIPLAIVIVFLGLRLFGPNGISPVLTAGPSGASPTRVAVTSAAQTPKSTQPITTTTTARPAVTNTLAPGIHAPAVTPIISVTNTVSPATAASTSAPPSLVAAASSPSPMPTNTTATTAPAIAEATTPRPGPGGTPPGMSTASVTATLVTTPISSTVDVSATTAVTTAAAATVTDTPPAGKATPRSDAVLGSIVLSRGIGPNKTPLQPSSTFSVSDGYIYVFYEFHNMSNGVSWSHRWFRGSSEVGSVAGLWTWGSDGRGYLFFSPAVGPGQYEIRLYIGDKVMAAAPFQIQ